ncbi:MAG: chaperone modulator CbpM [Chitinophagales bacterium]
MATENLIPLEHFCKTCNIEYSFIDLLNDYGLVEIITVEETRFLAGEQIRDVEKMIHLHYDLEINFEGLDAISHLLQRVENLRDELALVKNKLRFYEDENYYE